jgi:hypothetical protein
MRPEQLHYETIERHLQKCIKNGSDFFFDTKLFDDELTRLWETYDVPYEVRFTRVNKRLGLLDGNLQSFVD